MQRSGLQITSNLVNNCSLRNKVPKQIYTMHVQINLAEGSITTTHTFAHSLWVGRCHPPKCPSPGGYVPLNRGNIDPSKNNKERWVHTSLPTKQHLDQFVHCCTVCSSVKPVLCQYKQYDHATCGMCKKGPQLTMHCV